MKKILLALILASGMLVTGCEEEEVTPAATEVVAPAYSFEQVGYCKDTDKNRTFIIFTNATDKEDLIEEGRAKAWTAPKMTKVVFVNTKDPAIVKDNSLYSNDWDKGIMLDGMITDKSVVLGTYSVSPNGSEWWSEGGLPSDAAEELGTKRD